MLTKGLVFGVLASISYSLMTLCMKLLNHQTPAIMIVFFRFLVAALWVTAVLYSKHKNGEQIKLKSRHLNKYFFRSSFTILSMCCLRYSLKFIPLANANTLNLTYNLFVPLLGYLVYGYRTNLKNWIIIALGFTGILIVLNPRFIDFNVMGCFALMSGIFIAFTILIVAELVKHDSLYTILAINFWLTFLLSGILVPFSWVSPSLSTVLLLLFSGIMGTCYQEFFTRAVRYGPLKLVAPLQYSTIIFSGIIDGIVWGNRPSTSFVIGSLVIVISCLCLSYSKQN